jgi:hypothetical protein
VNRALLKLVPLVGVVGGLALLTGCGGTTGGTTASTQPPASSQAMQARLATIARELAASHGDPGAQGRTAVLTTLATADRLLGERVEPGDGARPVYLIWMYGNFDRNDAGRPAGNLLVGAVDRTADKLVYSTVPPGELRPDQPNPEELGLPEISLSGSTEAPPPDADTLRELRAMARRAASGHDDEIDSAEVFATNEQDAEAVLSPGSHNGSPDTRVYVITMHGRFEFRGSAPDGVSVPTGHFVAIVVGTDLQGRSSSFGNMVPDTSSLGPGIELIG